MLSHFRQTCLALRVPLARGMARHSSAGNNVSPRPRAIETAGRQPGKYALSKGFPGPVRDKYFAECPRAWHHVNARGYPLGRLASKIVPLLVGKHKPIFQMQRDVGDFVVVTNVKDVDLTGKKAEQKKYYRHSGYMGGLESQTYAQLFAKNPVEPLRRAVAGMLPKNKLRAQRLRRLRLYPGPEHLHAAQLAPGLLAYEAVLPPPQQIHALPKLQRIEREERPGWVGVGNRYS